MSLDIFEVRTVPPPDVSDLGQTFVTVAADPVTAVRKVRQYLEEINHKMLQRDTDFAVSKPVFVGNRVGIKEDS